MDLCKVCGKPSMVMGFKKVGGKSIYTKVPFRMGPGAVSFICGLCVAHGALRPDAGVPDEDHFNLRLWRKSNGMTQAELAESLMVSRVQVSKVESGERILPARWGPILEQMYPTHA